MDAKSLINAMIAYMVENRHRASSGEFDIVAHAVSVVRECSLLEAGEWLAEEIQERIAAQA